MDIDNDNKNSRDSDDNDTTPNNRLQKKKKEAVPADGWEDEDAEFNEQVPTNLFGDNTSSGDKRVIDVSLLNNDTSNTSNKSQTTNNPLLSILSNEDDLDDDDISNDEQQEQQTTSPFLQKLDLAGNSIFSENIKDADYVLLSRYQWDTETPYTTNEMIKGTGGNPNENFDALTFLAGNYATGDWDGATTLSTADWINIFSQAFETQDVMNDELSKLRQMAIRLAHSDPVALFPPPSWMNGTLNESYGGHYPWIAAYHIFGAIWKDRDQWFTPEPSPKVPKIDKSTPTLQDQSLTTQYTPTQPNKPGTSALRVSALKRKNPQDPKSTSKVVFTNPGGPNNNNNPNTKPNPSTYTPNTTPTTMLTTTLGPPGDEPGAAITAITIKKKPNKPSMYLSKALLSNPYRTAKLKRLKDVGRKFRTFVKVKFSKITAEKIPEQELEVSLCFQQIMERIWTIDPLAMLLPWKEESRTVQPLKKSSDFPKNKDTLSNYLDRLWLARFMNPYCRMFITHDLAPTILFEDYELQQWLEDLQLSLEIERIQARKTCRAGHLLGYHATVVNSNNLADAIQMQPLMQGISVEIRSEFIKLDPKKKGKPTRSNAKLDKDGKERTNVKIIQIYVAWEKAARARRALIEIYSSKANGLFPLGTMARFIPDTTDTRFIRTPSAVLAHRNSLLKHMKFMHSTKVASSQNIIELDHRNPRLRMTLRQAIMHIFSPTQRNSNLFVAVDLSYYGDSVLFAFRTELEEEAMNMISALPMFLEATTGHQAVWNWFTKDARLEAAYHTWDMQKGVIPNAAMDNDTQLENWEELDDIDDDDIEPGTIIQPFQLDLNKIGMNSYNDDGTIATAIYADFGPEPMETEDESSDKTHDEKSPINSSATKAPTMPNTQPALTKTNADSETSANPSETTTSISTDPTSTSQTPSTLTRTPDRSAQLADLASDPIVESLVNSDPAMAALFATLQLRLQSQHSGTTSNEEVGAADE